MFKLYTDVHILLFLSFIASPFSPQRQIDFYISAISLVSLTRVFSSFMLRVSVDVPCLCDLVMNGVTFVFVISPPSFLKGLRNVGQLSYS